MIDAHAHVHDETFDGDRDSVIERARLAGVRAFITIGTDFLESRQAVACAEQYPSVWASVGIHPHVFNEIGDEGTAVESVGGLGSICQSSDKVIAIGECGLDYFSHDADRIITEKQKRVQRAGFLAQVALAQELSLPIIVHTRPSRESMDAYEDMYFLLSVSFSRGQDHPPVILHCYMGDAEVTERFLGLPYLCFSFAGNITYKARAGLDVGRVLEMIPIDRMLAETDCPYLAPIPHRGKRNEPAYVALVAEHIAETKKISYTFLEEQLRDNIRRIFPKLQDI
ncbi:MAG: TatD family hydrolase [Candidatus Moranbacteria bacterium]|nr:TatD family hydrolase [Candidatus Moranbacteria bacterium]